MNGSAGPVQVKNRPRIPTPDVTKEVVDREHRLASGALNIPNQVAQSVALVQQPYAPGYPSTEMPVLQVVLSPIQELDGSNSVNNTLHAGQPGTAALAQAVLSPGLGPVLTSPVSLPMTVSQLTSLGLASANNSPHSARNVNMLGRSPQFIRAFQQAPPVVLTDITAHEEEAERNISSRSSEASDLSKDSKASNTTASVASKKSDLEGEVRHSKSTNDLISLLPSVSNEENRSRKTSAASQSNTCPAKRGEVYV